MTLPSLLERVRSATGADRELDVRIKAWAFAPPDATVAQSPFNGAWCIYHGVDRDGRPRLFERLRPVTHEQWQSDNYTSSIDAALGLVDAKLGNADITLRRKYGRWVGSVSSARVVTSGFSSATAPRSILAALLSALISLDGSEAMGGGE